MEFLEIKSDFRVNISNLIPGRNANQFRYRSFEVGRSSGYGRRTVEQTRSIDINQLRRGGYVGKPPSNWWVTRNELYKVGFRPKHWNDNAITLDHQILEITYIPWRFGGKLAYFACPCGKRVRKLFSPHGQQWRCRTCYDLTYATRQASHRDRLLIKAQKIREQLGGSPSMFDEFPARPKGMHWRRYNKLRQAHDQASDACLALTADIVLRLGEQIKQRGRP